MVCKYEEIQGDKLLQQQKKDPKKFWDFIKKLGCEYKKNLPDTVTNEKGECISEPKAVRKGMPPKPM